MPERAAAASFQCRRYHAQRSKSGSAPFSPPYYRGIKTVRRKKVKALNGLERVRRGLTIDSKGGNQ